MHSLNDVFAVLVSASQFDLIDPSGAVAASLLSGTDAALFPAPLPPTFNGLEMYHRDAQTTDSSLRWTYGDAGNETVQLTGPAGAGAATANRPRLTLQRGAGVTTAKLAAGQDTGGAIVTEAAITMQALPLTTYLTTIEGGQSFLTLRDDGQTNRLATHGSIELFPDTGVINKGFTGNEGQIYGVTFHNANAGGANATTIPIAQVTINMPAAGPAGGVLRVDLSSYVTSIGFAGNNAFLEIYINGAPAGALRGIVGALPVGQANTVHCLWQGAAPAGVFTLQGIIYSSANGAYNFSACQLNATYYR